MNLRIGTTLAAIALATLCPGNLRAQSPYPFSAVVALLYAQERVMCSAVILTDRHVLTAAHCVCNQVPLYVFVGTSVFVEPNRPGVQKKLDLKVGQVALMIPDFCDRYQRDPLEAMKAGDIALLLLENKLDDELVAPVLLDTPPSDGGVELEQFFIVGWGESDNFWRPGRKQYARIEILSRLCTAQDAAAKNCAAGQEIVAARPPADTCYADSGGGLYGRGKDGRLYLLGITSRAMQPTPGGMCGTGGIYTSLEAPNVRRWLAEILK